MISTKLDKRYYDELSPRIKEYLLTTFNNWDWINDPPLDYKHISVIIEYLAGASPQIILHGLADQYWIRVDSELLGEYESIYSFSTIDQLLDKLWELLINTVNQFLDCREED